MTTRHTLRFCSFLFATAGLTLTTACGSDSLAPLDDAPTISGNSVAGLQAFEQECASCHSARDAFDLAFFAFPDTTIVRRAVAHVDTATAHDIVAYVRTVRALSTSREFRPFQPGGRRAAGDANFAIQLFQKDAWPANLTADQLAAIDPLDIPIAIEFPKWSVEFDNVDWMPDVPIDEALFDYQTRYGVARGYIESYQTGHSEDDLIRGVLALRVAERDPANPDAPCVMEPFDRFQPQACFEVRRWIATLAAQHMLRTGRKEAVSEILHDGWWDVGNAARRSRQTNAEVDNSIENWAQWMYLGWAFEPDRHASVYLSLALEALGLPRHATFHSLRAMVVRNEDSSAPFRDVRNAARFSPEHWTYDSVKFGLQHLIDRLDAGIDLRRQDQIDESRVSVIDAYVLAARKIASQAERDVLAMLRDQVLEGVDALVPVGE
ncbi:MAG: hypothetical protein ACC682_04010 [Gemmatimonadota bacterium]